MAIQGNEIKWFQSSLPGSTGGVITTTPIPTSIPSGLFPTVPRIALKEGRVDYVKVFVKNTNPGSDVLMNPAVFILFQPTANERVAIALGTPSDENGADLTYHTPYSKETALPFPSLEAGQSQAIWIRRQVLAGQQPFETSTFQLAVFGYKSE
jgi:hypothetical protein